MSPEFYKIIHVIGILCLFAGIGGFLTYGNQQAPRVKMVAILHGVGLILILISGFGMVAKYGYGFPVWVILKVILWLGLGSLLGLAKSGKISPRNAVIVGLALGFVAAYAGLFGKFGWSIPSYSAPAAETQEG
ncbi:MAG: hypothetical protein KDN19_02430 [Verrucomicrobiae bacterium]|nr:hypothetical protein [Verrucomicrobiae bacterium]